MPFQFTCERCGMSFTRAASKPARFCSRACRDHGLTRFVCQRCGTPFRSQSKSAKHCSRACRDAGRSGKPGPDGTVLVPLNDGQFAIIDAEDAERILPFKWRVVTGGYAARCRRKSDPPGTPFYVRMHTVVVGGMSDGLEPDHVNGNRLDNRRGNLRPATRSQNSMNKGMQSNNRSGYRGVFWWKHKGYWVAKVQKGGIVVFSGCFHTPEEAAHAYDAAAREHFGEFARLNFPDN